MWYLLWSRRVTHPSSAFIHISEEAEARRGHAAGEGMSRPIVLWLPITAVLYGGGLSGAADYILMRQRASVAWPAPAFLNTTADQSFVFLDLSSNAKWVHSEMQRITKEVKIDQTWANHGPWGKSSPLCVRLAWGKHKQHTFLKLLFRKIVYFILKSSMWRCFHINTGILTLWPANQMWLTFCFIYLRDKA